MLHPHTLFLAATALGVASMIAGCKSSPPPVKPVASSAAESYHFAPRPTVAAPAVKVFHQDEDTLTLVTKADATDDEIAAILWQFHDAAHAHSFDALHLPEKFIDARSPTVWFHVYRGPKCAAEKFVKGNYPCGAKYNGAGDYTLGAYHDPTWEDAIVHPENGSEVHLWDPDAKTR